jgi:hypothetical protein
MRHAQGMFGAQKLPASKSMVTYREIKEHHQAIYSPMQIGIGLVENLTVKSALFFSFFLSLEWAKLLY